MTTRQLLKKLKDWDCGATVECDNQKNFAEGTGSLCYIAFASDDSSTLEIQFNDGSGTEIEIPLESFTRDYGKYYWRERPNAVMSVYWR